MHTKKIRFPPTIPHCKLTNWTEGRPRAVTTTQSTHSKPAQNRAEGGKNFPSESTHFKFIGKFKIIVNVMHAKRSVPLPAIPHCKSTNWNEGRPRAVATTQSARDKPAQNRKRSPAIFALWYSPSGEKGKSRKSPLLVSDYHFIRLKVTGERWTPKTVPFPSSGLLFELGFSCCVFLSGFPIVWWDARVVLKDNYARGFVNGEEQDAEWMARKVKWMTHTMEL